MINMPVLQYSSCVRCKTSIFGNPKEHLATCQKMARLDECLEELEGLGYESLSFEQIELLFDFLLTTELSGYLIADVISDKPLAEHDSDWQYEANDGSSGTAKWS